MSKISDNSAFPHWYCLEYCFRALKFNLLRIFYRKSKVLWTDGYASSNLSFRCSDGQNQNQSLTSFFLIMVMAGLWWYMKSQISGQAYKSRNGHFRPIIMPFARLNFFVRLIYIHNMVFIFIWAFLIFVIFPKLAIGQNVQIFTKSFGGQSRMSPGRYF